MILIIVLFFMDESIIINYDKYVNLVKALKMLRLVCFTKYFSLNFYMWLKFSIQ